jgi:sortase A
VRPRRIVRFAGTLLIAASLLTLAWVVVVWRWQDPFTAIYTHVEQSRLGHAYDRRAAAYRPRLGPRRDLAAVRRSVAAEAAAYRRTLRPGDPVGRLTIGRIGLDMVVVQGTGESELKKGPGHYLGSGLPGGGHLVYVAGHRTTYLAPFAHIDAIRPGDFVTFTLPYGAFTYRVTGHEIVPADDLGVLRDHGREVLRLQACHPRFFATHRYIVDARLVAIRPTGAPSYDLTADPKLAAAVTPARS